MKEFVLKNLYSFLGDQKAQLRIITFHDILSEDYQKFCDLIFYLKTNWNIISPNEFKKIINKEKNTTNGKNILISFDDAYKSQRIVTEKYLDPLNIKALFFIVSDFIKLNSKDEAHEFIRKNFFKFNNKNLKLNSQTKNMNLEDIKLLIQNGHTIGGHTKTHSQLSKIDDEKNLYQEIVASKDFLENNLENYKIEDFAYTFGDFESINKKSLKLIFKNFNYLYTGLRGNNYKINSKIIRRDAINLKENFKVISAYINGYTYFMYKNKLEELEKW